MENTVFLLRRNGRFLLRSLDNLSHNQRGILWRHGLQLPLNYEAYAQLCDMPYHHVSSNIRRDYNFLPSVKLHHLIRLSSNLAHWFPIFEHIKYFPVVLIKFLDVYKSCPTSLFETVATILENYCQHLFEDFPFAPAVILNYLERIIQRNDPILARHMLSLGTSASTICWMMLSTFFTQIFDDPSWYIIWDHILFNQYKFFLMVPLAIMVLCRDTFITFQYKQDLNRLQRPLNINIKELIEIARTLTHSVFNEIQFEKFTPLKRKLIYDCPKIQYSNNYLIFEDMDINMINKTEYRLLFNEMKQTKLKHVTESKIDYKDDICSRKRRIQLLEEYYRNIN